MDKRNCENDDSCDDESSLSAEWIDEIDQRMESLEHGEATMPWPEIRDAALKRLALLKQANTGGC